jgi:DDE family transposase
LKAIQVNQQEPPMTTLSQVSRALQLVFTEEANRLARRCGVVQRRRKLTGASLAQALVFGWLHSPHASIEQLAQTAAACGGPVCPQAIDQRFCQPTAEFFSRLLEVAVAQVVASQGAAIDWLGRFQGVWLEDSTILALPTCFGSQWPASGGRNSQSEAALKLYVELDLASGRLVGPQCVAGRQSDHRSTLDDAIPRGGIRVADLGYFDLAHLHQLDQRGVYWVTRVPASTALYDDQGRRLEVARLMRGIQDVLDRPIRIGAQERLATRLIVTRLPGSVVRKRRARLKKEAARRGRVASRRQRDWCRWNVVVTNLAPEQLSPHETLVLLKMRWQIELLFKRWKSLGRVGHSRSANPWRMLIETYAKLLGMVIQHWLLLVAAWQFENRSLAKASLAVQDHILLLVEPLSQGKRLAAAIRRMAAVVQVAARLQHRRARPPSYLFLKHPELIASSLT